MLERAARVLEDNANDLKELVGEGVCDSELPHTVEGLKLTLVDISHICRWLESAAKLVKNFAENKRVEALDVKVTPEELEALAEKEAISSPEPDVPMWLHCEEMGWEYDSDQSRGV